MTQVSVTQQEQYLLNLIASGESSRSGGDPYCSLYPSTYEPRLVTMTLSQVIEFQRYRTTSRANGGLGVASSACGRYQFIRKTLEYTIGLAKLSLDTRYTAQVQDFLILELMKNDYGLDKWKSGGISDAAFQLNLARLFASVPVPFNTQGAHRAVAKGESYYAGDRLNAAHHNADVFLQNLADIREGGQGTVTSFDIQTGSAGFPATGSLLTTQAEIAAGGGQRIFGGIGAEQPLPNANLPAVSNPYSYKKVDPFDNRYDFRTGQAVRELLINGTNPVAANALIPGNGFPTPSDLGSSGYSPEAFDSLTSQKTPSIGYNTGQVDPGFAKAIAKSTSGSSAPVTKTAPPPTPTTPQSDTLNANTVLIPRQIRDIVSR